MLGRRRLASIISVGFLVVAGLATTMGPAFAGGPPLDVPLEVVKDVDGDFPEDTEFEVVVTCSGKHPTTVHEVTFDEDGGTETILVRKDNTCTIDETEDGDAEDVDFECEVLSGPNEATCLSDTTVEYSGGPNKLARLTVINTAPEEPEPDPKPAPQPAAIVVAPSFTG